MNLRERPQRMAQILLSEHYPDIREGLCAMIDTWALQGVAGQRS
jgi:hypothetical protein